MIIGIFEVLGALAVWERGAKLIVLDSSLRDESRRFVIAANDEMTRTTSKLPASVVNAGHRAFLIDERMADEADLVQSTDADRPLLTRGSLALLLPSDQGNLVNFRDGSVVVAHRAPDDGSNDENTFPIWLDTELPSGRSFSLDQVASHFLTTICPTALDEGFEQELSDCIRHIARGLLYVSEAYGALGRTERASTGTQWLLHVDAGFRRFSSFALTNGNLERGELRERVYDDFFPSLSLPNPRNGREFEPSSRTGTAKSVAEAIEKFWYEMDGVNVIADSISVIDENRRRETPP